MIKQFKLGRLDIIIVWIVVLMIGPSADIDTASIVSSQCSEVSTASVPVHGLHPQARVVRRGQGEVSVRRHGSSRHQLPPRPKSLSMSVHTVQFEKGENKETFEYFCIVP